MRAPGTLGFLPPFPPFRGQLQDDPAPPFPRCCRRYAATPTPFFFLSSLVTGHSAKGGPSVFLLLWGRPNTMRNSCFGFSPLPSSATTRWKRTRPPPFPRVVASRSTFSLSCGAEEGRAAAPASPFSFFPPLASLLADDPFFFLRPEVAGWTRPLPPPDQTSEKIAAFSFRRGESVASRAASLVFPFSEAAKASFSFSGRRGQIVLFLYRTRATDWRRALFFRVFFVARDRREVWRDASFFVFFFPFRGGRRRGG